MKDNNFLIDNYIATNHWATCRNNFNSVLNVFNYYGFAFKDYSESQTDADLYVHLFNENGEKICSKQEFLKTGHSLHIEINSIMKNFQGIVSTQLVPKGKMKRLSNKIRLPIATSYFMMYKRNEVFCDFSHELFPIKLEYNNKVLEWMTILYFSKNLNPGFVIMNSLFNPKIKKTDEVIIELKDINNKNTILSKKINLNGMGSKLIKLSELIDTENLIKNNETKSLTAIVRGKNIEQPMSVHLHNSGDFNIHHF